VAVQIDPRNFEVTIASAFVLVTLEEDASRQPVIHKTWNMVEQRQGEGVTEFSDDVLYRLAKLFVQRGVHPTTHSLW